MAWVIAGGWFLAMWLGRAIDRLDLTLVAFSFVAGCAIWIYRRDRLAKWFQFQPRAFGAGAVLGVLLVLCAHLIYPLLPASLPFVESGVHTALQSLSTDFAWATLPLIAFAEELIFRGLILEDMVEKWGRRIAYPVSVLVYAGAQSGAGIALLPALAMGFGVLFVWQLHLTRGLWAPLITHLIWTPSVVVFFPIAVA